MAITDFLKNLVIGVVVGLLAITGSVSLVSLIFPENLFSSSLISIQIALIGVIVLAIIIPIKNNFTFAEPQDTVAVFLMIMVNAVFQQFNMTENTAQMRSTVLILIVLASLGMGLAFFVLGYFRLGVIARFIPYPIVGGFLAGTGWIIIVGTIRVITDIDLTWSNLPVLMEKSHLLELLYSCILAGLLIFVNYYYKNFFAIPLVLVGFFLFFHLVYLAVGASSHKWFLGPFEAEFGLALPFSYSDFYDANWSVIFNQLPNFFALIFTSFIAFLLNLKGLELVVEKDIDFDQELKSAGVGNLMIGCLGGLGGYQSLTLSAFCQEIFANHRIVGYVTGGIALLFYVFGLTLFSYIPKSMLGGLLFYIGTILLVKWIYDAWYKLPKQDYAIVILILLIIGFVGFLEGVIVGILIVGILFIIQYSYISVVKHMLTGETYQSNVDRSLEQKEILKEKGDLIFILQLQGFLFFGASYRIIKQVQERLENPKQASPKFVILDFRLVTGMDSSSLLNLIRLKQIGRKNGFHLLFTHLNQNQVQWIENIKNADDQFIKIFPNIDYGIAWCEEEILLHENYEKASKSDDLDLFLSDFQNYIEKYTYSAGEYLIRQGTQSEELYFIESGRVSAFLQINENKIRLRTMGAGTIVGELGFYLNLPRTASVIAEEETTFYKLTRESIQKMSSQNPILTIRFQDYLIRILSDRIYHANQTIQALFQ